ncbi:ECF transporter S component, partial [Staphylococcus aureus]|uniref:ECF transporter S component n=1 Tax=Staphylococcus aureus TaxID=1280 RepID=UPI00301BCA24
MSQTKNNTRKMAYIAILSAISFLLMYVQFQILPGADFLKLDFSILPILIGLVILDLKSAFSIL